MSNDPNREIPPARAELVAFRSQLAALRDQAERVQVPTPEWCDLLSEIDGRFADVIREVDRELCVQESEAA